MNLLDDTLTFSERDYLHNGAGQYLYLITREFEGLQVKNIAHAHSRGLFTLNEIQMSLHVKLGEIRYETVKDR